MTNIQSINRTREIISIIIAYGFKDIVSATPILKLIKTPINKFNFRYKGIDLSQYTRAQRVRMALEELGVTFVKLGQILSNRTDILPNDITTELSKLQDHVKPFNENIAISIIEKELDKSINIAFKDFSRKHLASASISQVHLATLHTGEKVAVKVKRPNLEENILMDLDIIEWLANIIEKYNNDFAFLQPKKLIKAFKTQLLQELDLNYEKNNTLKFYNYFQKNKNIKIPKVYEEYSTKNILTLEYIEGKKISDISKNDSTLNRSKLVSIGIDAVLEQIFMLGFFHADPHPGNLMALENNVLCFLDFGMIGFISPSSKESFTSLIMNLSEGNHLALAENILELCDSKEIENIEDFNLAIFIFVNKYNDIPLESIDITEALNELIYIIREFKLSFSSNIMLLIKSLIVLEGVALNLDKKIKLMEHIKVFALKYLKDQMKIENIIKRSKTIISNYSKIIKTMPSDIADIVSMIKNGNFKVQLEHKKLDDISKILDDLSNRLSYSIVLASLILASSLITTTKIPPLYHNFSLIGITGFLISGIMGFIMIISRIIKKYKK